MSEILTEEDKQTIDEALKVIDDVEQDIVRAHEAGVDISDSVNSINDTKVKLLKIRSAFFPNG
jgi:ArsR family metal-binding transcriptional regulator